MNCEECKEQVFELIEREAVDPAGVQAILERCPECHALFNEMKAVLRVVDELPMEDPSAHVDLEILRAAAARRSKVTPLWKRPLQAPPWAMAAIALLAVSVGVWAIPRTTQLESHDARRAPVVAEPEEALMAEQAMGDEAQAMGEVAKAEPADDIAARETAPSKSVAKRRERSQAKRKTRAAPTEEVPAAAVAEAPASQPAADAASAGAARATTVEAESLAPAANRQDADADDAVAACRKKVKELEERQRADKDYKPDAEQHLETGRCYRLLGDVKRARQWLERAKADPKTKSRAEKELDALPAGR